MRNDFQALDRVNAAQKAASLAFPMEGAAIKEMNPEAAPAAHEAESNAADHAQVRIHAISASPERYPWTSPFRRHVCALMQSLICADERIWKA